MDLFALVKIIKFAGKVGERKRGSRSEGEKGKTGVAIKHELNHGRFNRMA